MDSLAKALNTIHMRYSGKGLAVGSERFKKTVARRLHRSLECLPPRRPKKSGKIKGAVPFNTARDTGKDS